MFIDCVLCTVLCVCSSREEKYGKGSRKAYSFFIVMLVTSCWWGSFSIEMVMKGVVLMLMRTYACLFSGRQKRRKRRKVAIGDEERELTEFHNTSFMTNKLCRRRCLSNSSSLPLGVVGMWRAGYIFPLYCCYQTLNHNWFSCFSCRVYMHAHAESNSSLNKICFFISSQPSLLSLVLSCDVYSSS